MDPNSRAAKKNTSNGNGVLSQDICILYKNHVTNAEVRAKIQLAIGPQTDLLTIAKRCRLKWYGHVSSSSDLPKATLQATVKGGRRQTEKEVGRQHQGVDRPGVCQAQRAVESREKGRKLVVKSSVPP